jgi:fatty acid desaturase
VRSSAVFADHLRYCSTRKHLRPVGHCWFVLGALTGCYFSLFRFPKPILFAICFLFIGVLQHDLFIVLHEAVHFLLFRNRRANEWIGNILGGTIGFTMGYREHHLAHHHGLGSDVDPDLISYAQSPPARGRMLADLIGCLTGVKAILQFLEMSQSSQARRDRRWRELIHIAAAQCVLLGIFVLIGHPIWYGTLWLLPLITIAKTISFYRTVAEHSMPATSPGLATRLRTFRPAVWERLLMAPMNFNFHAEHHWFPGIPYYHLPELASSLETDPEFNRHVDRRDSYIGFLLKEVIVPGWKKRS